MWLPQRTFLTFRNNLEYVTCISISGAKRNFAKIFITKRSCANKFYVLNEWQQYLPTSDVLIFLESYFDDFFGAVSQLQN